MNNYLYIFFGGGLGSIARYFIGKNTQALLNTTFPFGTLLVNILASFILGLYLGYEANPNYSANYRALIAIGFCGGFSTFSTFSNDTLQLIYKSQWQEALLNIFLNVFVCILATFVGIFITK
jgi:fluoride exporter